MVAGSVARERRKDPPLVPRQYTVFGHLPSGSPERTHAVGLNGPIVISARRGIMKVAKTLVIFSGTVTQAVDTMAFNSNFHGSGRDVSGRDQPV